MSFDYRVVTEAEYPAFLLADERGFSGAPRKPDQSDSWARGDLHRAFGAFDGDALVGTGRNYTFELTVPGGAAIPAAAVSWISTNPTHRRRAVRTGMMEALHRDARQRGEVVSMLTASEGSIYRRFGYGIATSRVGVTVERGHNALVSDFGDGGSVRFVTLDEAAKVFPHVYEMVRASRAGMVSRPEYWWPEVLFGYPNDDGRFCVVHEDASGTADGYAFYFVGGTWNAGIPDRTIDVFDIQGTSAAARAAVWRYLFSIDLVSRVTAWNVPVDDPMRWLLADPRRWRTDYVNDGLYLHLLDVDAALAARRYECDGELTIACASPDGTEHVVSLEVADGRATVQSASRRPDLAMPIGSLSAIYLGGVAPSNLAASGWITEVTPGALHRADKLFLTAIAPALLSYF